MRVAVSGTVCSNQGWIRLHQMSCGEVKLSLSCDAGVSRFARVRFMEDPAGCDPVASLGFDVLAGVPSAEELAPVLAKRRVAIKSVLLDQVPQCVMRSGNRGLRGCSKP